VALGHHALLAVIERRRPAELRALALGALDPFLAALADQAALELGKAAHDRQHQLADVRRGVAPASPSDTKPQESACSSCRMLCKSREERARRSSLVTTTTSPGNSALSSFLNSGLWTCPTPSR